VVVNNFYRQITKSGIFYFYVNCVFFSTVIFFAVNDNLFTVEEVLFGIIAATLIARGVSNILCALGVYTVDLKTYQNKLESRLKEQQAAMALTDIKYKNKSVDYEDNKDEKNEQDDRNKQLQNKVA